MAKEWISDIRWSPDGTAVVIGSHDNAMYALRWPNLKPMYYIINIYTW